MTNEPMTAHDYTIRAETLLEFAARLRDGAEVIESFAADGRCAVLIAYLMQTAGMTAARQAADLRAAEKEND